MRLADYLAYVAPVRGSLKYHKWSFLTVCSALLEKRVWIDLSQVGLIYPNMFVMLVGPSGAGKSTSSRIAERLLHATNAQFQDDACKIKFAPDVVTPAAFIEELLANKKEIQIGEQRLTYSPIFIHASEMAPFINDIGGGSLMSDLLKFYDNEDSFKKKTRGAGAEYIIGPCVTFLADTTPTFMAQHFPREATSDGFTARFIIVNEPRYIKKIAFPQPPNREIELKIKSDMLRLALVKGQLRLSDSAIPFYISIFDETENMLMRESSSSLFRSYLARRPVHLLKLATILSLLESNTMLIDRHHLEEAIALLKELEPDMTTVFASTDMDWSKDSGHQVLQAIPYHPIEMESRQLYKSMLNSAIFPHAIKLEAALDTLVKAGKIKVRTEGVKKFYTRLQENKQTDHQ